MIKRRVLFCCLGLALLTASPVLAASFPFTVHDVLGRRVTIPAPPRRIVSLAPSITEQLFAVGAGDRIVGVTLYDNYPPQVRRLERVGGYVAKSLSVEKILSLRPDLVLARGEIQRGVIEALERLRLPVVALEPSTFDEVYATLTLLGRLTDQARQAARVVADMQRRVARVRHKVAAIPPPRRVSVFYKGYVEPLLTAGPSTFIGRMIDLAGGINIFADLTERYPQISAEEVLRRNPDIILEPASNGTPLGSEPALQRPGWRHLAAVQHGRVYLLDDDLVSRPGPRLAEALEEIAAMLYPALFSQVP
jgi:iron complex transport system substrate-binding protein